MRKIEQQMNDAIREGKDWKSGNTQVITLNNMGEDVSFVYLHGNHIAIVGDNYIRIYDGGWQSNTTKSRLNAILEGNGIPGERIFQEKFEWKLRMSDGTVIPFFSGMRLNQSLRGIRAPSVYKPLGRSENWHTGACKGL